MSYKITNRVWEHSSARGPAHHVLLAIADRANDEGLAWPSMGDIARRCRIGIGTVQRAIQKLVEIGELEVSEGGKGARSNHYRVVVQEPASESGSFQSGTQSVPERNTSKRSQRSGAEQSRSGAEGQRSGAEGQCSAPGIEPTKNPSENRSENQPLAREPAPTAPAADADALRTAQPLIDEMTRHGMRVSWQMQAADWKELVDLIRTHSVPVLVDHAERVWRSAKTDPYSVRYFLPGWRGLPDTPADTRPPLRAVSGGYQPYREPTPEDRAADLGHF